MIRTLHRRFISEVWYSDSIRVKDIFFPTNYINYIGAKKICHFFFFSKKNYTYITNLEDDEEIIWQNIRKNVKYEINKGKKEELLINNTLEENKSEFIRLFNIFALNKGLSPISQINLNKYPSGTIYISKVTSNNESLSFHVYLRDKQNNVMRLLYSITNFEIELNDEKLKKIGIANKYLHWEDIRFFKSLGVKSYDWGGIAKETTNKSLIGINNFKLSFGGYEKIYYSYSSISYVIIKFLISIIK